MENLKITVYTPFIITGENLVIKNCIFIFMPCFFQVKGDYNVLSLPLE